MKDVIMFGANCTWYGDTVVAKIDGKLPCCPKCGSPLFEMPKINWCGALNKTEKANPGYLKFMTWLKDNHHKSYRAAREAYKAETGLTPF